MSEKKISRREFLKGGAALAASTAILGLAGCAKETPAAPAAEPAAEKGIYTPGTYSASATGMGVVVVKATFDANAITNIELDVSNETEAIGQAAKDELIKQAMAAQSAEIDGVSGATITSNAVKTALKNCIAQAKGEPVDSGSVAKAEVASEGAFVLTDITAEDVNASAVILDPITDFAETVDVDIVVAGAGAAGVIAAVRAAELGAKVAMLQKESVAVSQGNCSSAIIKSGCTEGGLKKWLTFATAVNCWRNNRKLLEAYIDRSEEALRFVCEKGGITEETEWKNEKTGVAKYQDTSATYTGVWHDGTQSYDFGEDKVEVFAPWFGPKPNNYGNLVAGILSDAEAEYSNLKSYFSTPIVQLIKDGDAVVGCVGQKEDGSFIKFNAKAVILATGAYENNASMVRRFCPDIENFDKKVFHRTGDGNILAISAGGVMEPVAHSRVMHDFDAGLMWDEPPYLILNMAGERFVCEDVDMAYISNVLRWQPRFKGENMDADHKDTGSLGWYCQIFDDDYMSYATGGVPEVVMKRYFKEGPDEDHVSVFPELIDTFRADTIEELAEKLGLPVEATVASVNRYNELCEKGEDLDFGKKPEYLHKFEHAPFWGIRRHIRCSSITAGVLSDEYGRVTTESGDVVKGLYVAGNLGGQFYGAPDYPFFHPGLSLGHAVTFGYIAGEHAAKNL